MDPQEALTVLGLPEGVALAELRSTYRRLLRTHHPDVAGSTSTAHANTALLTQAYEVAVSFVEANHQGGVIIDDPPHRHGHTPPPAPSPRSATPTADRPPPDAAADERFDVIDAQSIDDDTIAVTAPAAETYAALFEAAGRIGEVAYFDRQLGIVETIVRFQGGPTCSVMMTLQGRADGTDIFCTMESIEAAPAPNIRPVLDALVEELRNG